MKKYLYKLGRINCFKKYEKGVNIYLNISRQEHKELY